MIRIFVRSILSSLLRIFEPEMVRDAQELIWLVSLWMGWNVASAIMLFEIVKLKRMKLISGPKRRL